MPRSTISNVATSRRSSTGSPSCPRHADGGRQDEQDQRRHAEQQEPAASRAAEELSGTRQEHREEPGEKSPLARLGHTRSLGGTAAAADARKS